MDSPIDEIKQRLNIVDVISGYIKLEKAGANYRALCPFHSEKKPSFFVSPARQIWHCFGACGEGGDIFKFVMKIEGVEFGDALRILARKAGVELKRQDPRIKTERKRFYDVCELATKFFEAQLNSSKTGKQAKDYLLERGINKESIEEWRVGYAPDAWQGLLDFLVQKGFEEKEIERVGLAVRNEKGNIYDRFRSRIIFPIFDLNSEVIGFGGRVFGEKEKETVAKYINISNTPLYDKSKILYGLDRAKLFIRKADECVLVEGYTDVIMSHQAGVKNVISVSGTALTPFQLSILKRYSNNLATCFDMDIAGGSATKRGIDLAQRRGFNIKVVILPKGADPADVISRKPKDWQNAIKLAKSILDFHFENAFSSFDRETPEGKKEISRVLIPVIKRIPNKIEASHWIRELAKRLDVSEESVEEEIRKFRVEASVVEPEEESPKESQPKTRQEKLEERILCLILDSPDLLKEIELDPRLLSCFSENSKVILEKLQKKGIKSLRKSDFGKEINNYLDYLFLKSEIIEASPQTGKDIKEELTVSLKEFRSLVLKKELDLISQQIRKAEKGKNSASIDKLMKQFNQLSKELFELG